LLEKEMLSPQQAPFPRDWSLTISSSNLASGGLLQLRISRWGNSVQDDLAGDAHLLGIEISYTAVR
jgi:hypothetical protein